MTKKSFAEVSGADVRGGDDVLAKKWASPRVVRSEVNRWVDPGIDFSDSPSMTDVSQAAECDVNHILDRYAKTGFLPGQDIERVYADLSAAVDYQAAMEIVVQAQEQFEGLDPFVRKRFGNDPVQFLEFVHDPKNASELVKMGLGTLRPQSDADRVVEAVKESGKVSAKEKGAPPRQPAPKVTEDDAE